MCKCLGVADTEHVLLYIYMEELSVRFCSPSGNSSTHIIYCKKHSLRQQSSNTPNGRTLFTVGWPPYCGNEEIREIFSRVGVVEKVYLQHNPGIVEEEAEQEIGSIIKRRDFGYIVFKNEEGVSRALSLCSKMVLSCAINNTGLSLWCREYMKAHPCESTLESTAQEGVVSYDMWAEEERKRKKRLSEPDEEGWITVTKKTPTDPKQ